jgi:alkanesulfonate monooxygenase SsuD/methylene tetrahydromethanopterin reductase-like flavin-dependent oxidoreductase (luciferase family)
LVGGESPPALRRAARDGDGWVGLAHSVESCAAPLARLHELRVEYGRADQPFETVCLGRVTSRDDAARFEEAGITRLLVTPWDRSREALDGVRRFAAQILE